MEFTKEDLMNLLVFLQRTQMTGQEVEVFYNLYNKIAAMIENNKE